jgi:hypothetical protein
MQPLGFFRRTASGDDNQLEGMFSHISPEKRVPADHPLRPIRKMVDEILKEMSPQFAKLHSDVERLSIGPERLLSSLLPATDISPGGKLTDLLFGT